MKRPAGPFAAFASEQFQTVQRENPDAKPKEVFGLVAEKWKNADKERYKADFARKLREFNAPLRKVPHRPPTSFAMFVRDNFAQVTRENPESSPTEVVRIIAEEWKELSDQEREGLKEAYLNERREYERRVMEFGEDLSEEELEFLRCFRGRQIDKLEKERRKLLKYPRKPATPFGLFLRAEKETRGSGEQPKEWLRRMGAAWRNLGDSEKDRYREQQQRAQDEYKGRVLDWERKHQVWGGKKFTKQEAPPPTPPTPLFHNE